MIVQNLKKIHFIEEPKAYTIAYTPAEWDIKLCVHHVYRLALGMPIYTLG